MSSTDNLDIDEGETLILSFISTQDLSQVQIRQEIHSLLGFLYKILHSDTITIIPTEFGLFSLLYQLQISMKLSDNVLELIKSGTIKTYTPLNFSKDDESFNISLIPKNTDKDVLGKLLSCEYNGIYLDKNDIKLLMGLIIGSLRDTAVKELGSYQKRIIKKCKRKKRRCKEYSQEIIEAKTEIEECARDNQTLKEE